MLRGLWNWLSWMARRRAHQMAHIVTSTRASSAEGKVSTSHSIQSLASSVRFYMMVSVRSSSARAQTHRAMRQSKREWRHVSTAAWHKEHSAESAMLLCFRTSPVGIEVLASLHAKTLIFEGTLTPHNLDHHRRSASPFKCPALCSNQSVRCCLVDDKSL